MTRAFTPKERELIQSLVKYREDGDLDNLQAVKLIRKKLDILAVRYKKNSITLYAPAHNFSKIYFGNGVEVLGRKFTCCTGISNNKIDPSWMYQLSDILSLLRELEEHKYIVISRSEDVEQKEFFDRKIYDNLLEEDKELPKLKEKGTEEYVKLISQTFKGDIAELFDRYGTGMIFPLESLIDLSKNDFEAIEQRNFKDQMKWTRRSVYTAVGAILISAIISAIMPFCSPGTKMDSDKVEIIENAIIKSKDVFPTQLEVPLQDTLKMKNN